MKPQFTTHASICSFCGRSQREIKKMVPGYNAIICDECVAVCMALFLKQGGSLFEDVIAKAKVIALEPDSPN